MTDEPLPVPVQPGDDEHHERSEQQGGDHQVEHQPIVQHQLDQALAGALEQRGVLPVAHCTTCGNLHPVIHHACCANAAADRADLEREVERAEDVATELAIEKAHLRAEVKRLQFALAGGWTDEEVAEYVAAHPPALLEDG